MPLLHHSRQPSAITDMPPQGFPRTTRKTGDSLFGRKVRPRRGCADACHQPVVVTAIAALHCLSDCQTGNEAERQRPGKIAQRPSWFRLGWRPVIPVMAALRLIPFQILPHRFAPLSAILAGAGYREPNESRWARKKHQRLSCVRTNSTAVTGRPSQGSSTRRSGQSALWRGRRNNRSPAPRGRKRWSNRPGSSCP